MPKNTLNAISPVTASGDARATDSETALSPAELLGAPPLAPRTSDASPLFYLHIPKAGGSSLLGVVENQFAVTKMLVMYDVDFRSPAAIATIHDALPKHKQSKLELIAGHFGFGAHEQVGAEPNYFTMLREPAGRVISNYRHMRRNPRTNIAGLEKRLARHLSR